MVARGDITMLLGSNICITLHLLYSQSPKLAHFVGDKENLESSSSNSLTFETFKSIFGMFFHQLRK